MRPPLRDDTLVSGTPRPEPLLLPPPVSLFTVAHARRSASSSGTPRASYPRSIWRALRFCLSVYFDLSPRGMTFPPPRLELFQRLTETIVPDGQLLQSMEFAPERCAAVVELRTPLRSLCGSQAGVIVL